MLFLWLLFPYVLIIRQLLILSELYLVNFCLVDACCFCICVVEIRYHDIYTACHDWFINRKKNSIVRITRDAHNVN